MKFLIAMVALVTATSFAETAPKETPVDAPKSICGRFMVCGTYIAPRDQKDENSRELKITITATGELTATFDYTLTGKDGKAHTWPLVATFTEEGVATMRWQGQANDKNNGVVYATAICDGSYCNYALVPFESKENGKWGNAGIMNFTGTTLEFMMTVGTPVNYQSRGMVLQKQ